MKDFDPKHLENSSRMMGLALEYGKHREPSLSYAELEHWKIHLKVDYKRLQALLDNEMCAPDIWIEHLENLLKGNVDQLFDCDLMFCKSS